MDCEECKQRMLPENPESPFILPNGWRLPSLCSDCPGRYDKPQPVKVEHVHRYLHYRSDKPVHLKPQASGYKTYLNE